MPQSPIGVEPEHECLGMLPGDVLPAAEIVFGDREIQALQENAGFFEVENVLYPPGSGSARLRVT